MAPRIQHPAFLLPGANDALQALGAVVADGGVDESTIALVLMRASQINGCAVCLDGHIQSARKNGESDERLGTLLAWRDTPYFTEAERAALALTEAMTRQADRPDPVPDELWAQVASHYDEKQLATLVLAIANINVWNRLNVATAQQAGVWKPE
ncbi:MAG TPA: carboxymuconolactone decarboxylase family protein [Acidimicrobiales bacterium]|jgi:AhpD family alkylhydroperoxidase